MPEGYREPQALPQRKADQSVLLEATGRAPVPFWWNSPEKVPMIAGRRPSVPHAAYAAAALEPPAGTSSTAPKFEDTYVHWLYAQNLGYQGFQIALEDSRKSIVLTTPPPTKDHLARMITSRKIKLAAQQELFDQFESVLTGFEREVPLETGDEKSAPKAKEAPNKRRVGPRKKAAKVTWKPKKEEPPSPQRQGTKSLQLLQDMFEAGRLTQIEYTEAVRTVKRTVKDAGRTLANTETGTSTELEPQNQRDPDPEPEPKTEPEPEVEPAPPSESEVAEESGVAEEVREVDPAQEIAEAEEAVEPPAVSISDALSVGVPHCPTAPCQNSFNS